MSISLKCKFPSVKCDWRAIVHAVATKIQLLASTRGLDFNIAQSVVSNAAPKPKAIINTAQLLPLSVEIHQQ